MTGIIRLTIAMCLGLACAGYAVLPATDLSSSIRSEPSTFESFTLMGVGESGALEFHGTVLVYEKNGMFRCAANLVLFDQRGKIKLDQHAGSVRKGEFGCSSQDGAWVRIALSFYPGISDGDLIFVINSDKSSGEWRFETGHGVSMQGKIIAIRQQLGDDYSSLGVEQHLDRWAAVK